MRFNIETELSECTQSPVIGNVYNVCGGRGARHGHMMVIISIVDSMVTTVTVNKSGDIISGRNYGLRYFEDKCPMAYVSGLEDLNFKMGRI